MIGLCSIPERYNNHVKYTSLGSLRLRRFAQVEFKYPHFPEPLLYDRCPCSSSNDGPAGMFFYEMCLVVSKGFQRKKLTDSKVCGSPVCPVVVLLFGKNGGKKLSLIDFDITLRMEDYPRQSDITGWPQQVYKMTWPRKARSVVHLFEEHSPIIIFRSEECPRSVRRTFTVVCRLYLVTTKFNERVSIEALASGHVET